MPGSRLLDIQGSGDPGIDGSIDGIFNFKSPILKRTKEYVDLLIRITSVIDRIDQCNTFNCRDESGREDYCPKKELDDTTSNNDNTNAMRRPRRRPRVRPPPQRRRCSRGGGGRVCGSAARKKKISKNPKIQKTKKITKKHRKNR